MTILEQNNNSLEISRELLKNLIKNTESVSNQEILKEFTNLVKLIDGNKIVDDLAKNSIYIENAIGKIYTFLLTKIKKNNLENFNIIGEESELEEGDTNYSRFSEEIENNNININQKNILKLFGFLDSIINSLYKKKYIQKDLFKILIKINRRKSRLKSILYKGENLKIREKEQNKASINYAPIEWGKKDKEYSDERNRKFEQNKTLQEISGILNLKDIKIDTEPDLIEAAKNTNFKKSTIKIGIQKAMKDELILLMKRNGIELDFSRKGYNVVSLGNGINLLFVLNKLKNSTIQFLEDGKNKDLLPFKDNNTEDWKGVYYFGGSDIVEECNILEGEGFMTEIAGLNSKNINGVENNFLTYVRKKDIPKIVAGEKPDIITAKYIDKVKSGLRKEDNVVVAYYDSNCELGNQIEKEKYPKAMVWTSEIGETLSSVADTGLCPMVLEIDENGKERVVIYDSKKRDGDGFDPENILKIIENPSDFLVNYLKKTQFNINPKFVRVNNNVKKDVNSLLSKRGIRLFEKTLKDIINFRAEESANFEREITKSRKIPLIKVNEELLEKDGVKSEIYRMFQENFGREYGENFTQTDVLNRLSKIINEGGKWFLKRNKKGKYAGFIATAPFTEYTGYSVNIKNKISQNNDNDIDNVIAEVGTDNENNNRGFSTRMIKEMIEKNPGNFITRTNIENIEIIEKYEALGFEKINVTEKIKEVKGLESNNEFVEQTKVYLVYKNNK